MLTYLENVCLGKRNIHHCFEISVRSQMVVGMKFDGTNSLGWLAIIVDSMIKINRILNW